MTLLIDTSVLLAGAPPAGKERWSLSVITVGELNAGVLMARTDADRISRLRRLTSLVRTAHVLAIDIATATRFGELRAATGRRATNDLWIAATALAHDLTLVTADRSLAALPAVRTRLVS